VRALGLVQAPVSESVLVLVMESVLASGRVRAMERRD
jgi:hypothetical protein